MGVRDSEPEGGVRKSLQRNRKSCGEKLGWVGLGGVGGEAVDEFGNRILWC